MTRPMFEHVALVGIGLIGSSISHAARRRGLAGTISGSARTQATVDTALVFSPSETAPVAPPPSDVMTGASFAFVTVTAIACSSNKAPVSVARTVTS